MLALGDVTERDGDWHRSFIRLFSDNEARENAWGLGWGGKIYSMACGIHYDGNFMACHILHKV